MGVDNIFSAAAGKFAVFPDRLRQWQLGEVVRPITVEIHPSERCNHQCPDCQARYVLGAKRTRALGMAGEYLNLQHLKSLWEAPPAGVVVSGNTGDPLMHPRFAELLDQLSNHQMPTVLITNLQGLNQALVHRIISTCRGVRISLDAWDSSSFRRRHGKSADWKKVLSNIRTLVNKRDAVNGSSKCLVGVGYLTDEHAREGMLPAAHLAKALGVDYIQFRPYHFRASDLSRELKECRELASHNFAIYESSQKYAIHDQPERSYSECHGSNFFSVIDARSDVYLCCHQIGNPDARYGSLARQTWQEIIESSERIRVRRGLCTSGCVPLCRLHAHNEWLEQSRGKLSPLNPLDDTIKEHACFL